jgi:hypothetical protein
LGQNGTRFDRFQLHIEIVRHRSREFFALSKLSAIAGSMPEPRLCKRFLKLKSPLILLGGSVPVGPSGACPGLFAQHSDVQPTKPRWQA